MNCPKCNEPLEEGSKRCEVCGAEGFHNGSSAEDMDQVREKVRLQQEIESQRYMQQMAMRQQEQGHEMNMHGMKSDDSKRRLEAAQNLTPEQLMALAASEGLDKEAAAEFAKSLNSRKETELMRENSEKIEQITQARVDDMKEMMKEMMAQNRDVINVVKESSSGSVIERESTVIIATDGGSSKSSGAAGGAAKEPKGGGSGKSILFVVIVAILGIVGYMLFVVEDSETAIKASEPAKIEQSEVVVEPAPEVAPASVPAPTPAPAPVPEVVPEPVVEEVSVEPKVVEEAVVASQAGRESYEAGLKAYNSGDYNAAMKLFKKAANEGSADACLKISEIYANGVGPYAKNSMQAKVWQDKADKLK